MNANTNLRRRCYFLGKFFLQYFLSFLKDIFRVIPKANRVEMNEEEKASVQTIFQGKGITKAKKDRLLEVLFECIVLSIDVPEDEDSDGDKNRYHIKLYMPSKPAKMHIFNIFFIKGGVEFIKELIFLPVCVKTRIVKL